MKFIFKNKSDPIYVEESTSSGSSASSSNDSPEYDKDEYTSLLPGNTINIVTENSDKVSFYSRIVNFFNSLDILSFLECKAEDPTPPEPPVPPTGTFVIDTTTGTVGEDGYYVYGAFDTTTNFVVGDTWKCVLESELLEEPFEFTAVITDVSINLNRYNMINWDDEPIYFDVVDLCAFDPTAYPTTISPAEYASWRVAAYDPEEHQIIPLTITLSKLPEG